MTLTINNALCAAAIFTLAAVLVTSVGLRPLYAVDDAAQSSTKKKVTDKKAPKKTTTAAPKAKEPAFEPTHNVGGYVPGQGY